MRVAQMDSVSSTTVQADCIDLPTSSRATHESFGSTQCSIVQADQANITQGTTEPSDTVAPILALPPEILGKIFLDIGTSWGRVRNLLRVTHICSVWRSIALDLPALWVRIDCAYHPSLVEAMLHRSKEAPLEISYHRYFHRSATTSPLHKILREAGHRLKFVYLRNPLASEQAKIVEAFPTDAATLELFHGLFSSLEQVPETFLQGNLPSLQNLEITGLISWRVLPLTPRLTTLKIHNVRATTSLVLRPNADTFLRSLTSMPELQHLVLTHFLPYGPSAPLDSSSALPHLESLTLNDRYHIISSFLSSCRVLVASRIHIASEGYNLTEYEPVAAIDQCLSALSKSWKTPTMACRMAEGVQHLALRGWGKGKSHFQVSFQEESVHTLEVGFAHHNGATEFLDLNPYDVFIAVTGHLDLSPLQSLTMDNCEDLRHAVWREIFSPLLKLRRIHLGSSYIKGFLTAAVVSYEPPALPPFPALTSLAYSSPKVYDDSNSITALTFILSRRPTAHRIEELRLTNCTIGWICARHMREQAQSLGLGIVEEGTRIIERDRRGDTEVEA